MAYIPGSQQRSIPVSYLHLQLPPVVQLTTDGTLQLVCHNETVKDALVITSRRTYPKSYTNYDRDIAFKDIESSYDGGAIYGAPTAQ